MIFDHVQFTVSNYDQSKKFFTTALAPLGIGLIVEIHGKCGLGRAGAPQLWFGQDGKVAAPLHLAFAADNREQVRKFHAAALAAGGKDNGPPGIRAIYHPNYYGAFVIGPDGHNIEAVCHLAEA
jgi:catechol 2,3-dioxygenase-like lactoylglutathione lyase family enzyme